MSKSKFWLIDWSGDLYFGGRFTRIPLTGPTAEDLTIEDVEIHIDEISITLQQLEIEDVEIATEVSDVSLLSRIYIENVEMLMDDVQVSITPVSYGQNLAADGMDRRAVA